MAEGAADPATPGTPSPAPSPTPTHEPAAPSTTEAGGDDEEVRDPAALLQTYRRLQEREKTQRARLAELETAHKRAEDAKLSEQERLSKRVAELESQDATRQRAAAERILQYEIRLQAVALHIIDPGAAAKLIDLTGVEYDAEGQPLNLDKALKALVKDKPYLVAQAAPTAPQPAASVANPASRSAVNTNTTRYSSAEIADRDFYVAHREDIIRAMREGRIDP